jgi:hypothetical protein
MEPSKFSMKSNVPLYHSINYASFTQKHMNASNKKSQIALLDEIRIIMELYLKGIIESKNDVQSLYDVAKNTNFVYYHNNPENYAKIKNTMALATEDAGFTSNLVNSSTQFPNNAAFFKGCIQIKPAIIVNHTA